MTHIEDVRNNVRKEDACRSLKLAQKHQMNHSLCPFLFSYFSTKGHETKLFFCMSNTCPFQTLFIDYSTSLTLIKNSRATNRCPVLQIFTPNLIITLLFLSPAETTLKVSRVCFTFHYGTFYDVTLLFRTEVRHAVTDALIICFLPCVS